MQYLEKTQSKYAAASQAHAKLEEQLSGGHTVKPALSQKLAKLQELMGTCEAKMAEAECRVEELKGKTNYRR